MEHFYAAIPGWCDYADYYAQIVAALPSGSTLVEVGAWQGQSTACLGVEIANSGKDLTLDVVDWFRGSPGEGETGAVGYADLRQRFDRHVAPIRRHIRAVHQEASVDAAAHYADGSLAFVWLDAAHDASSVLADLMAWWPKVQPGGILAGHDRDWASVALAVSLWAEWAGVTVSPVSRRSWQVVKPVPVTDWRVAPADRRCLVAVVSNERMVYRQTAESLVRLGWGGAVARASAAHGFRDISFTWVSRHVRVDDLRNEAVLVAQAAQASHLLFLDADMTWPPDVLERMLAHHDRGIVSGLYFLKAWPNHPVAFSAGRVNLETQRVDYTYAVVEPGRPGLVPQALIGMGCALIPMRVFETLERPWFAYRQDPTGAWTVTEDVAFCQKAAAVGCPISLDASVVCGHVHQERIGPEHYMRSAVESLHLAERMDRQAVPA